MNFDNLAFLANTVVAGGVASCLATVAHWMMLRQAGVPITRVQFFLGPGTVQFQRRKTTVAFGSIPIGSNVNPDEASFRSLHWSRRLLIVLSGPATLLLLAALFLGLQTAFNHFTHGFGDLLQGVLHPKTAGLQLVAHLREIYDTSFLKAAGVLCTKLAALNLLPLAGPAFFQLVRLFFKSDESPVLKQFGVLHALSSMLLFGFWGYIMMYYALTAK